MDIIEDPKNTNHTTFESAYFNRTSFSKNNTILVNESKSNSNNKDTLSNNENNIPKIVETTNCYIILISFISLDKDVEYENVLGEDDTEITNEDRSMMEFNDSLKLNSFLICKSEQDLNDKLLDLLRYNDYIDVDSSIIVNNKRPISKSLGFSSDATGIISISKYMRIKSNERNAFEEILDSYIHNQEDISTNGQTIIQDYSDEMKSILNYISNNKNINITNNIESNDECPYETFDDYLKDLNNF